MHLITGKTKLLGVIGDPIEHSLSPVMHNEALAHLNLDYVYVAFPIKPSHLATALAGFEAIDLVGFNITIPHKQAIMPLLSEINPVAQMVGAVNTVWRSPSGWQGTNTDVLGFISPLKELNKDWHKINPVILGNGGAARAVVTGCFQLGCGIIKIVGRNLSKLEQFKQSWKDEKLRNSIVIHHVQELSELVGETELLVNTTPVGMYPHVEETPVSEIVMKKLQPGAIAYDLIYTPNPTRFLKLAQQQGAIVIDGLPMLVNQGAAALEIWIQQTPPIEIMTQSLARYLSNK